METKKGYGFGTAPVFLAAISTILGAILFLRFGYAVANTGLVGSLIIIVIGHAITIPTALAIAEIATNVRVEGGGEYFIISRSFGPMIGGTIGISLYLSQAVSVAFYMIAFSEAFKPVLEVIFTETDYHKYIWIISIPATILLLWLILKKGANIGVNALWIVVAILGVSLALFFLGSSDSSYQFKDIGATVKDPDSFFLVFAIIFPAFTGMTAGVGLSGDLKNPRKSLPLGTLSATLAGMFIYVLVVVKYAVNMSPDEMAADQFAMAKIALWSPIIYIGLAAASLSSAIGSILIAPRTLQALGNDSILPLNIINRFIGSGKPETNEPVNATLVTAVIVLFFVSMGSIDFVAQIISMFFMITYGSLCLVSFLEHFAGNPSYRPTFRSKWYLSLIGALACFIMMFQMAPLYALFAVIAIIIIYITITRSREEEDDLSSMLRGVLFQLTRRLQILIQRKQTPTAFTGWRPSVIAMSSSSFSRLAPFDLLRWISHYYGFGTFIHYINGLLNEKSNLQAKQKLDQLIQQSKASNAGIYVDTIISPSFKTAIAQIIQIPGISGMENNSMLFEFHEDDSKDIADIIEGCQFAAWVNFNLFVLRSSEHHFGYKNSIHIWLTPGDYRNANLMIILAYIIMGHPEWKECTTTLFAAFDDKELNKQALKLNKLIDQGRIPISHKNVQKIPWNKTLKTYDALVCENSENADLVIMGFSLDKLMHEEGTFFKSFKAIKEILFVRAGQKIVISDIVEKE
jgi:amino acid transporter